MAISTRSLSIANEAGCPVKFDSREPRGRTSVEIFMAHACAGSIGPDSFARVDGLRPSLSKILGICGGLPIALSVIGRALSKYVRHYRTFDCACDVYAVKLEKKRELVGKLKTEGGASLNAGIALSLECVEAEFSEYVDEHSVETGHTVSDLYVSLCVVSNQVVGSCVGFGSNVGVGRRCCAGCCDAVLRYELSKIGIAIGAK